MSDTVYRFLPWSRRGLAAAIPGSADGAAVPARAKVEIQVVVAGAGAPVSTSTELHGPGDVIGLDPTVIVRTIPRPGATNVEPNYLAAVDFDQPELPWLFTPTGVPTSGHLRPWLVLVVVAQRPGVSVEVKPGAPLPQLTIQSGAGQDLPDLRDSWAWAHVQLLDSDAGGTAESVGKALADRPDRNVSRLVCPRRLTPGGSWLACLVPAFDAGVKRGLGQTPDPAVALKDAWDSPDTIVLPVYYHWAFQTGPQGDFESLARRLKPYEASASIGRVTMHVGAASPFVDLPENDPARFLPMDGALQAPRQAREHPTPPELPVPDPDLGQVPEVLRTGLRDVTRVLADAADGVLDGQAPEDGEAIGPPVYAGAHVNRSRVDDGDPTWLRELNTDPRCRVAAGLGAEVMRTYQEEVVAACWQQVGDVLAVEQALSRARLSLEVGRRFRDRHLEPLPPARQLQVMAPLAGRTLLDHVTVPTAIAPTSLPDQATEPALRRFTAPTARVVAGVRRRARTEPLRAAARAAGEELVASLSSGRADVDATRFPVVALDGFADGLPAPDAEGKVSLERYGVDAVLDQASAAELTTRSGALTAKPWPPGAESLRPRVDLRSVGVLTDVHLSSIRDATRLQRERLLVDVPAGESPPVRDLLVTGVPEVVDRVERLSVDRPDGAGFLIEVDRVTTVLPLGLRSGGRLAVLTPAGTENLTVARLGRNASSASLTDVLAGLPAGTISPVSDVGGALRPPLSEPVLEPSPLGPLRPPVRGPLGDVVEGPFTGPTTVTLPSPTRDISVVERFERAMLDATSRSAVSVDPDLPVLVPFALARASAAVMERSDPLRVHPARLHTMIAIGGHGLLDLLGDASLFPCWTIPERFDRVMAYPKLDLPAYTYLAQYDRTRFCPGIDEVPPESVTLLETNPRFIAGFMAGLNHETARELMWRGYPTDGRGTPWRKFWKRVDGGPDIAEMHTWGRRLVERRRRDDLPAQTTDPLGNLVLLVRGDLLRRYPRTMAVAVRATRTGGRQLPSASPADLRTPVFAGAFDPDVSFFGFPLVSADLTDGEGWFFGLLEPVTEPRFGFDETVGRETAVPTTWNDVAWPDLQVPAGGHLAVSNLAARGLTPSVGQADGVAAALFQRPFKLLVHARHLVKGV